MTVQSAVAAAADFGRADRSGLRAAAPARRRRPRPSRSAARSRGPPRPDDSREQRGRYRARACRRRALVGRGHRREQARHRGGGRSRPGRSAARRCVASKPRARPGHGAVYRGQQRALRARPPASASAPDCAGSPRRSHRGARVLAAGRADMRQRALLGDRDVIDQRAHRREFARDERAEAVERADLEQLADSPLGGGRIETRARQAASAPLSFVEHDRTVLEDSISPTRISEGDSVQLRAQARRSTVATANSPEDISSQPSAVSPRTSA